MVGEELGLWFTLGVVAVFTVIFIAGLIHLRRAPNLFQFLLVTGCLLLICLQAIINLGVVTGMFPTKGMSLPFISAGLSNLLLMGLLLGILLNTQRTWGRAALGGRAATREKHGFFFNLGPHALYREGELRHALRSFGIDPTGAIPGGSGGFAVYGRRLHTLPTGFMSLVTTDLLPLAAKFELARLLSRIGSIDASRVQDETLEHWLAANIRHQIVRDVVAMLVRVTTFTNAPQVQSAGAAIEQLQLATRANVLYVDGGWQTIVDALRRAAIAAGAQITTAAPAVAVERRGRTATGVRLADGTILPASSVIVTGSPAEVDALAGTAFAATLPPPVRHATLDIGLRALPNPRRLVAFGVDRLLWPSHRPAPFSPPP